MALSIKHPKADRLARELAARTGESLTEAVINALEERLERKRRPQSLQFRQQIELIRKRCASLPLRDRRTADEIIGYDEYGLPR